MAYLDNILNKVYYTFIERRFLSRWMVLFLDVVMVMIASALSYSLVQQIFKNLNVLHLPFWIFLLVTTASAFFCFLLFRINQGIIRYSTLHEIQKISFSLFVSQIINFVSLFVILGYSGRITFSYCVVLLLTSTFGVGGFRLFIVHTYQRMLKSVGRRAVKPIYIFGTGPESVSLREMVTVVAKETKYKVVGFVTTEKNDVAKRICDLPIILFSKESFSELKKNSVKTILYPNQKYDKGLVQKLISNKVEVLVASPLKDINDLSNPENRKSIRPIQIEDLLGRDEIEISLNIIAENIEGRNVLVTGAAGSIGSEIVRQVALFHPKTVICLDQAETPLNELDLELKREYPNLKFITVIGDIRNEDRMTMVFSRYRPDVVYHAAAYKHVPMMEKNPCEAIMTNVFGTQTLVDKSIKYGVQMFVMISTDKAVNPTNVMGASKRLAEIYVQACALLQEKMGTKIKFVTTRFGNVLGSNGSVIPLFRKQIEKGGPLTVTDPEITRYFMTIPEACRLVLEASVIGETGYIYVFDMGEPVKIADLASKMIELAGFVPNEDIEIVFSGLRPGEKLYEELLNDEELTIPTKHEKVLIAKVRAYEYEEVRPRIDELIQLSRDVDIPSTVQLMKELVPEYVSHNSEYSKYDKDKKVEAN